MFVIVRITVLFFALSALPLAILLPPLLLLLLLAGGRLLKLCHLSGLLCCSSHLSRLRRRGPLYLLCRIHLGGLHRPRCLGHLCISARCLHRCFWWAPAKMLLKGRINFST